MYPSINPVNVVLFMDWKHGNKDEHLFNNDNEIVCDVNGMCIFNNGGWNGPTSKHHFLTTMTKLHKTYEQGGEHSSPCEICFDNYFTKGNKRGCMHHVGAPKILHSGNPRTSPIVQLAIKKHQHVRIHD